MSFINQLGNWLSKIHQSFANAAISGQNIVLTKHNGNTVELTLPIVSHTHSDYVLKSGDTMTGTLTGSFIGNLTGNVTGSAAYLKASNINYKNIDTDFDTTYVIGLSNSDHGTRPETSWINLLNLDSLHFQSQLAVANISSTGTVAPNFYIRAKYASGPWSSWVRLANDNIATTTANGLMSATDKTKLDGISTGAEVNQNAFSYVKVDSTTIAADSKTDTLELAAGTGITLTPDTATDKVTIKVIDDISPVKYLELNSLNIIFELNNKFQIIAYTVGNIANGDTITFPRAFGANPIVLCAHPGTALVGAQAHTVSTTGFKVAHSYGASLGIRYIAIGKGI